MKDWTPSELEAEIASGSAVFLKVWKEGCGACKLSEPAIERLLAMPIAKEVKFGQVSATQYPEILEIVNEEVLPLFFVFKNKAMIGKVIGFKGIAKLQELLSSIASSDH